MTNTAPRLPSVAHIIEQAEMRPRAVLPATMYQSFPVPVRGGRNGLRWLFLYGPCQITHPQSGLTLYPPDHVAFFHAGTARFDELRPLTTGEFGIRKPANVPIGHCRTPGQALEASFLNRLLRWQQAFDIILPAFAAKSYGLTDEQQRAARDFVELTPQILEPPLMPYYQAAGTEFFDWLKLMKR